MREEEWISFRHIFYRLGQNHQRPKSLLFVHKEAKQLQRVRCRLFVVTLALDNENVGVPPTFVCPFGAASQYVA
jgi:hypothetical protein